MGAEVDQTDVIFKGQSKTWGVSDWSLELGMFTEITGQGQAGWRATGLRVNSKPLRDLASTSQARANSAPTVRAHLWGVWVAEL